MGSFHLAKLTANRTSVMKMRNKYIIFRIGYAILRKAFEYETEKIRILTSTSSLDQQTSMFTQLVVREDCAHNYSTISYLPPSRRTSTKDDFSATMGNCASRTPASSVIKSSRKGFSRSRRTKGVHMIRARWRSTSSSGFEVLLQSSTLHPVVSRRNRWSMAKCFAPWKCRRISKDPWVSTDTMSRQSWQ